MTEHNNDNPTSNETPVEVVEAEIVDELAGKAPTAAQLGLELPEDPVEAKHLLMRELATSRAEAVEYLDNLQRVAADFDNYRRRIERDQAENVLRASQRIVEALLPTLDAFDAALAYSAQTPAEEKILDGMRGTHIQFMDTLGREGLQPIDAAGRPFDPAFHEAVAGTRCKAVWCDRRSSWLRRRADRDAARVARHRLLRHFGRS